LVHGSHGQAQLGGGHLIGPATISARGAGDGHARFGPLEFGQGGKDAGDPLTVRKCGVDAGAAPGQHLEVNATCCEVMHHVDQVLQIAAKPVQFPNETDRGFKERLLNLLAPGQALTRTRPLDLPAIKNDRLGDVVKSLEQTGELGRTQRGW
jgi:hypothetical protein